MTRPMIWSTWPLVADLNNDSGATTGTLLDDPPGDQPSTREGEDGLKRRAACDECRMHHILESLTIGADSMQGNAS
jgi:hypothetical protein